jgi:hypothetical protein
MKRVLLQALTIYLVGNSGSAGITEAGATADLPSADEVIERALAQAEERDTQRLEASYTFYSLSKSEKLDKEGNPKETETRKYRNVPYKGHSYARLIEINGAPLDAEDKREEEERESQFREKVDKGEPPEESEEERMAFDEELVSRYDFEMIGLEQVGGRWAYAIGFEPKDGKLPARRRIDRALNKSSGTIWFDRESYSIAKLQFELTEKMKIWWGFIGSISKMRGNLEFQPVEKDVWMPSRFEFYINGRIFFRSLHQNQILSWSDFESVNGT